MRGLDTRTKKKLVKRYRVVDEKKAFILFTETSDALKISIPNFCDVFYSAH